MAAAEEAVFTRKVEFETVLDIFLFMPHGAGIKLNMVGIALSFGQIVIEHAISVAVIDNTHFAQFFGDITVFGIPCPGVCSFGFGFSRFIGIAVELCGAVLRFGLFVCLSVFSRLFGQYPSDFVIRRVIRYDGAVRQDGSRGGAARYAGSVFVAQEELSDFGIRTVFCIGRFGIEPPTIVEIVFEAGKKIGFIGTQTRPIHAEVGISRQPDGIIAVVFENAVCLRVFAWQHHSCKIRNFFAFLMHAAESENAVVADIGFYNAVEHILFAPHFVFERFMVIVYAD